MNTDISAAFDGNSPSALDTTLRFPSNTIILCESGFTHGPGPNHYGYVVGTDEPQTDTHLAAGVTPLEPTGALRHHSGSNYGFADRHASWYRPEKILTRATNGSNTGAGPSFSP